MVPAVPIVPIVSRPRISPVRKHSDNLRNVNTATRSGGYPLSQCRKPRHWFSLELGCGLPASTLEQNRSGRVLRYAFFQPSSLMCEQSFEETPRLTLKVRWRVRRRFGANNICHHRSCREMADYADDVGEALIAKHRFGGLEDVVS